MASKSSRKRKVQVPLKWNIQYNGNVRKCCVHVYLVQGENLSATEICSGSWIFSVSNIFKDNPAQRELHRRSFRQLLIHIIPRYLQLCFLLKSEDDLIYFIYHNIKETLDWLRERCLKPPNANLQKYKYLT